MRRHNRRLFRIARAIVRDADEAEDLMQEAYVRAFEHLEQFEGRARFATWLTRIAGHEDSARSRRGERVRSLDALLQDGIMPKTTGPDDPSDGAASREVAALLEKAVDALPDLYRTVFVLREVEGLGTAEAAECLEVSAESVKVRLHRAKKLLRAELERKLGEARQSVYEFHLSRCDRSWRASSRASGARVARTSRSG